MTNYGQSNREIVQDTNAGLVDPPVTESAASQSSIEAKRVVDKNIGQEGRLASALIDTAGEFGQLAVAEKHRNERIEGAKLVADGKAEEYINATEPTFAEKLFGNKPKMRVAQEMQVQQDVNRLDDDMRTWVNEEGHKLDSDEFQKEYDKRYDEVAGKYNDNQMKDLVSATYAQNLEQTRSEHARAHDLFKQQHLRDTTMKGWSESAARASSELLTGDPTVQDNAMPKLATALAKPEDMSQSAYEGAAFDMALSQLAEGKPQSFAIFDSDGTFDNLTHEQQQILDEHIQINQIKNDEEFGKEMATLRNLAQSGNIEGAAQLAKELQLKNPKSVDSINQIRATAEAAAQANALKHAENQKKRTSNVSLLNSGQADLIAPADRPQAYADQREQLVTNIAKGDRDQYVGQDTYPEDHVLSGQQISRSGTTPSENEMLAAQSSDAFQIQNRANWIASGDNNHPDTAALLHRAAQLQAYSPADLRANPERTQELDSIYDQLDYLSGIEGGEGLLMSSFDSGEEYADFQRINAERKATNLPDALNGMQVQKALAKTGFQHEPERKGKTKGRKNQIAQDFVKDQETRQRKVQNKTQLLQHIDDRYEANLAMFQGDARRAEAQTAWELKTQDGVIGNKFVPGSGELISAQETETPGTSLEDQIALRLSDPDTKEALVAAGIPELIQVQKNELGQWIPRLNVNTMNKAGVEIVMIDGKAEVQFPPGPGGPAIPSFGIGVTTPADTAQLQSYQERFANNVKGVADTTWNTMDKGLEVAVKDSEYLSLNYEHTKLRKEVEGTQAQQFFAGVKENRAEKKAEKAATKEEKAQAKLEDMSGASQNVVSKAASDLHEFLWPQPLVTNKSERGYQSPRHIEAARLAEQKQKEHLEETEERTKTLREKIAALRKKQGNK